MTTPDQQSSLIETIDARQNEVLSQLDELNQQVEALLDELTAKPSAEPASTESPEPVSQ